MKCIIEKVRKDDEGDIIKVKTDGNFEFTTPEVIEKIERADTFVVIDSGTEILVEVIKEGEKEYIRTVKDGKQTNNLDELPQF